MHAARQEAPESEVAEQFCLWWLRCSFRAFWVFVRDFGFERCDLDHARKHGCGLR